jgi:hypothetical protein
MDKTFVDKHKFGIVALLFFILLVSQKKILNFLTHTILGRLSLIFLLLGISNFSILLGVVAVLFVIIMINKDDSFYLEAFDPEVKPKEEKNDELISLSNEQKDNLKKMQDTLKANKEQQDTIASSSVSAVVTDTFKGGREGYNTMDRERVLQQGKNSNQLSIGNANQNAENVLPFDQMSSTPFQI